jgi:hypothetical protein
LVLLVAVALSLTGCARIVDGMPLAAAPALAPSMGASTELGDYNTVDPCSMVDIEGLPTDLQAQLAPAESLDYCSLEIDSAGNDAEVDVGELLFHADDDAGDPDPLPSGLSLYTGTLDPDDGSCTADLEFADGVDLASTAYDDDEGNGTDALCTAAAEVARNVSGVLARGPVTHRRFPANSFGTLDPCTMLNQAALDTVPVGNPTPYPAHHECDWGDADSLSVSLTFIVGPPPAAQQDATASQIAGRNSVTYSDTHDSEAECWIDTGGVPFASSDQDLVEIAEIFVGDPGQSTDQACAVGTTVANIVWPELPATS